MKTNASKLRKENNKLEESFDLSPEAESALTDIVSYLRSANINVYQQEVVRRDITNMIIDGEKRGLSVKEIIGDDYKSFCDNVIAEVPKMSLFEKAIYYFEISSLALANLVFVFCIASIADKSFPIIPITLGPLIAAPLLILAAVFIVNFICKSAFEPVSAIKPVAIIAIFLMFACSALMFLDQTLFHMHIWVLLAIGILLYAFSKLIDHFV